MKTCIVKVLHQNNYLPNVGTLGLYIERQYSHWVLFPLTEKTQPHKSPSIQAEFGAEAIGMAEPYLTDPQDKSGADEIIYEKEKTPIKIGDEVYVLASKYINIAYFNTTFIVTRLDNGKGRMLVKPVTSKDGFEFDVPEEVIVLKSDLTPHSKISHDLSYKSGSIELEEAVFSPYLYFARDFKLGQIFTSEKFKNVVVQLYDREPEFISFDHDSDSTYMGEEYDYLVIQDFINNANYTESKFNGTVDIIRGYSFDRGVDINGNTRIFIIDEQLERNIPVKNGIIQTPVDCVHGFIISIIFHKAEHDIEFKSADIELES